MFDQLKKMFGSGEDLASVMKDGAQIVDVRSRDEFAFDHLEGSVNIPLNELSGSLGKINKNKPVIVCCASGMRSASAKSLLKDKGYEVYNGGGWKSLLGIRS